MASIVAQAGADLYQIDPTTGASQQLTLPAGVTLSEERKPRFAVLNRWAVLVHSPTRNLAISPEADVLLLSPTKPASAPTAAAGTGTLNGSYFVAVSFVVKDASGADAMESARSANSNTVALVAQGLSLSSIPVSPDSVPSGFVIHRRIYRTTSGGTILYHLTDIADNVTTTLSNESTDDAALELIPAEQALVEDPPGAVDDGEHMKLVVSWGNRLWGVSDSEARWDDIRFTDDGSVSKWSGTITARPAGVSQDGVVALIPRRNQLLILKRNGVWQISGTSEANFSIQQLVEGRGGCVSADTVVVINDAAYWLAADGVYRFSANGLECITDGDVAPWFKKNTHFNRNRFQYAFARFNELRNQYELHLAAAGSSAEDRWVSFNTVNSKWYGPHNTDAFTPTSAGLVKDADGLPLSVVGGSDGRLYLANNETFTDGSASAIDFDCTSGWFHGDNPNAEHYFGKLYLLSKVESAGTLTVIPTVGRTQHQPQAPMYHDLRTGRQELGHIGDGAMFRLRFRQGVVGQGVSIYGYEAPDFENGTR